MNLRKATRSGRQHKRLPTRHPRDRSFGEILEELRLLGLAGKYFTPGEYADALAEYLDITIHLLYPDDRNSPFYQALRSRYKSAAGLRYVPEHRLAIIEVPESFEGISKLVLVFHELSHIAAGHPIPDDRIATESRASGSDRLGQQDFDQIRGVARREPPRPELRELDADLRARDLLRASIYGPAVYDRVEQFVATEDRSFPRPTITPSAFRNLFR